MTDKPTGLEMLEQMMASGKGPAMAHLLGFRLTEAGDGFAIFTAAPKPDYYNPMGTVHGGWTAAILDSAMGCAVQSVLPGGKRYTTIELKVNYVRALTEKTGDIICKGTIIHPGCRIATSQAHLTDTKGRLYSHATCTCMIF